LSRKTYFSKANEGRRSRKASPFAFKGVSMSKKPRKNQNNNQNGQTQEKLNFVLKHIDPLTQHQKNAFHSYSKNKNLLLLGSPGSGKSFLSIYLALREILNENSSYKKLIIVRSAEPTKNVGFLPGSLKEKIKVLEEPYEAIVTELFNRGDAYQYLKNKGIIEFLSTSYIRGITLSDSIILVDEVQNLAWNELYSILTRVSDSSKVIFSGDFYQSDLNNRYRDDTRKDDIIKFASVIKKTNCFDTIEFDFNDIVRNPMIKSFIINAIEMGYM
jgi:predicted ribonuclease YlaK